MFPQDFIDKIKDTVNLVELVEEYCELKKCGPFLYQGHCPHPNHNDSSPSFRVFKKGYKSGKNINLYDTWACMGCHSGKKSERYKVYGSDCISFIQWIENLRWKEAVIFLAEKYYIPLPKEEHTEIYRHNKNLSQSYTFNLKGQALEYIKSRGLDDKDLKEWCIGFDGQKIVFPLMDRYKNVLGFTRRWIKVPEGRNDKYKNSANSNVFVKSSYLYGIHKIDEDFEEIRISEGPLDVIIPSKYNAKNIVATLGTAFTDNHIKLIKHYKKTPVFCMDGDEAGLLAIKKSVEALSKEGIYSKILILPNGKDLCELSLELKEDIEEYIKNNAITYGDFLIRETALKFTSQLNELKLKFLPELKEIISKIPSEDEKIIIKSYIKNNFEIDL